MSFILLWLFLGHFAYSVALAKKVSKLEKLRISNASFFRGMSAILLGPLAFLFVDLKKDPAP